MKSNPLSLRLSYNKSWLNQDFIRFKNISLYYSYNLNLDRLISKSLLSRSLRKLGIIYSHTTYRFVNAQDYGIVRKINGFIKLNVFLADIRLNDYIRNSKKRRKYKCIQKISKIKRRNYWFLKQWRKINNSSIRKKQYDFINQYMKEQYILDFLQFIIKHKIVKYIFNRLRKILIITKIKRLDRIKKSNKYLRIMGKKLHYNMVQTKYRHKKLTNFKRSYLYQPSRKQNIFLGKRYIGWNRFKLYHILLWKFLYSGEIQSLYQQNIIFKKKCKSHRYLRLFQYGYSINSLSNIHIQTHNVINTNRYLNKMQISFLKNLYRRINMYKFLFIIKNIHDLKKMDDIFTPCNRRRLRLRNLRNIALRKLIIQKVLFYGLRRIENNITTLFKISCSINVIFIKNFLISPIVVVRYIVLKLKMRYRIGELIKPILKTYYRFGIANGIRSDCAGRFTRKQRASFLKYAQGKIALTTIDKNVNYEIGVLKSKYGACSVKYWLFH